MSISNANLYFVLWKRSRISPTEGPSTSNTISIEASIQRREERGIYKNSAKHRIICILMTLIFVLCWFPVSLYYFLWLTNGKAPRDREQPSQHVTNLASCNSLLNPCIYLLKRKDFRCYMKQLFCTKETK